MLNFGPLRRWCFVAAAVVMCPGAEGAHGSEPDSRGCEPQWSAPESGPNDLIDMSIVFDDGTGEALYIGGVFTSIGGQSIPYLARWDGESWHSVGPHLNGPVRALCVHDDESGPVLVVGGDFTMAGDTEVQHIA